MRAAATLALLATVAAAALATPARGADRLARAAVALEREPLFVHPDLLWMLPAAQRAEIITRLRGSVVPIRVAVLPVLREDESHGDERRILFGIQQHLDRPGVLVVVDEDGWFEVESFEVARDITIPSDLDHVGFDQPLVIGERLARLVEIVERAPAGPATRPEARLRPVEPDYVDDRLTWWQVLLVGAVLGATGYAALRVVVLIGSGLWRLRGAL